MPATLSRPKKALFALVTLALLALLAEGAARLAGLPSGELSGMSKLLAHDRATLERTVGLWQPGFRGRIAFPPELAFRVSINSLGLRGPEVPLERTAGTARILCLGDSTTFGVFAGDADTYPARLEALLRERGARVEVLNGGHPVWSLADEVRFLRERAGRLAPDLVIHLFCTNDPLDLGAPDGSDGKYARQLARVGSGLSPQALWRRTALAEVEARARMGWEARTRPPGAATGTPWSAVPPERFARHAEVYAALVALCREREVKLVSACFPNLLAGGAVEDAPEAAARALAERHGVPFIPLAEAARRSPEPVFNAPLDYHASPAGNALIAREVARFLEERGLPPFGR